MIKRVFMTLDDLKILCKGAIGSMTFGAYHMYITTNMINENNRNNQLRIDEINKNNQIRIEELMKKIEKLENKRYFF
jgi:hypothetical protein